jgi:hypothetical protein
MVTTFQNGYTIETWYDRKTRNWISQVLNENHYQLGNAEFSGNKKDANETHKERVINFQKTLDNSQ